MGKLTDSELYSRLNRFPRDTAKEIFDFCVANGRILQNESGSFNPESVHVEVEFEATERGMPQRRG